jgi:hypothetical protein
MSSPRPRSAARDVDAGGNLQVLLVAAVVAVLVTRLYLNVTGYPRVGSGEVHIAHLLWGGLFMLAALVVLLSLLGKHAKRWAAVLGGLGFGLFVDELGKFVTADNDYFFQPAVALIYVLFVLLFLVFKAIERRSLSADELLINAADMLREVVMGGATRAEVVRARRLLDRSGCEGPLAEGLRDAIDAATRVPERSSRFASAAVWAWRSYDHLLDWPWFPRAIWLVFVGQAVLGIITASAIAWAALFDRTALPIEQATVAVSCADRRHALASFTAGRVPLVRAFGTDLGVFHARDRFLAGPIRRSRRSLAGPAAAYRAALSHPPGRSAHRVDRQARTSLAVFYTALRQLSPCPAARSSKSELVGRG